MTEQARWDAGENGMATVSTRLRRNEYHALRTECMAHGLTMHELLRHLIGLWVKAVGTEWPEKSTVLNDLDTYGKCVTHYIDIKK